MLSGIFSFTGHEMRADIYNVNEKFCCGALSPSVSGSCLSVCLFLLTTYCTIKSGGGRGSKPFLSQVWLSTLFLQKKITQLLRIRSATPNSLQPWPLICKNIHAFFPFPRTLNTFQGTWMTSENVILESKENTVCIAKNYDYFIWSFWNKGNDSWMLYSDLRISKVVFLFHQKRILCILCIKYSPFKVFPAIKWYSGRQIQCLQILLPYPFFR